MLYVMATGVVVPASPVRYFGDTLLNTLYTEFLVVLPYAAYVTAFVIGVRMIVRWLGHRKALSARDWAYDDSDNSRMHARRETDRGRRRFLLRDARRRRRDSGIGG